MDSDGDFEDFSEDDAEFIALTLKPPKPVNETQTLTSTQQIVQLPPAFTHQSQNTSSDILAARGEIAVLRAKIQELEKQKQQERDQLLQIGNTEKETNKVKIKTLENAVQRLEDERKFLSVEVRNLSNSRKKRKVSEEHDDVDMDRSSTPSTSMSVPNTAVSAATSTKPVTPKPKPTVKLVSPKTINENSLFIENILNHTIIGCHKSTMEMLSHIIINTPCQNDDDPIFHTKPNIPISTTILEYLVSKQDILRLDVLITRFAQNITLLIQHIFHSKEISKFAIPYLISILHATISFRSSAITSDTTLNLCFFIADLILHHTYLIKKQDEITIGQRRFEIPAIQRKFIDQLILVFSLDLLESLFKSSGIDGVIMQQIINEISSQLNIIFKLGFSSNSCLIVMFPLVEILSIVADYYEGVSEEILMLLTQVLNNGIQPMIDMCFNGLNRILGDNEGCKLIEDLINWNTLIDSPKVIYSIKSNGLLYDFSLINLQLKICESFEKIIIDHPSGIEMLNKDPVILKLLISSISKQQELLFKSPRSDISHLRSKLISSLIQTIHLIWELQYMNHKTIPRITKDTTHELIITLSRIAFSANITSNEASQFLYELRKIDKDCDVFNKWSESRAREISHLNEINKDDLSGIVNAEVGYSNGLEFAFDDIVVELSRDILEKCTTMDEADNLYLSMNAV